MPDNCIFCKIAQHQITVTPVFEDDFCLAFPDMNPQAPTHLLVIPKQHYATVADAPADLIGHLAHQAAQLAQRKLPNGFRLVINTGHDGGQTVHHLHIHILGGRPMHWPPG